MPRAIGMDGSHGSNVAAPASRKVRRAYRTRNDGRRHGSISHAPSARNAQANNHAGSIRLQKYSRRGDVSLE